MKLLRLLTFAVALLATSTVFAQAADKPTGLVALGVGYAPAFEGSDTYKTVPFFFGGSHWNGVDIRMIGLGVKLGMLTTDNGFVAGPIIHYRPKRDSSDGDGKVQYLGDVKGALEVGGFINYHAFGDPRTGAGQLSFDLSAVHDLNNAYDGFLLTAKISYAALRTRMLSVDFDISSDWGDADYQRTYFGISQHDSSRSGLAQYRPAAGFRDIKLGVTLGHQFNQKWGVLAHAGVKRYVDQAKDSPIVHDGSRTVGLVGVMLSRRF